MKKLTKLIFSCAAVAALTAAVGSAAMAANDFTVTPAADKTSLTIGTYDSTGADQTILVLKNNPTTVTEADIIYVDQIKLSGDVTSFTTIPLDAAKMVDGEYTVRIGGSNTTDGYLSQSFRIGEGGETSDRLLGDVDNSKDITASDAAVIVEYTLGQAQLSGDSLQAADVDDSADVTGSDAAVIVEFTLGDSSVIDGAKTIDAKQHNVPEATTSAE